MTDVTKEDFAGLETRLVEAITNLGVTLKESLAAVQPVTPTEVKPIVPVVENGEPVEIDHAAIAEALRENSLPAASAKSIVESLKSGLAITDAVQKEVDLREAFVASTGEHGIVHLEGGSGTLTGRARALSILEGAKK